MHPNWFSRFRFSTKSVLVLILGIALGFSLNLQTLKLQTGRTPYSATLPEYVIEPPDVLEIDILWMDSGIQQPRTRKCLVGPDGRVNLDNWGLVYVAGKTIGDAQKAIEQIVHQHVKSAQVVVNVNESNSKRYYVITQDPAAGDTVQEFPFTGNETVLDAIANRGGLKSPESTQVYVARQPRNGVGAPIILPVEWAKIAREGSTDTNYSLLPGDRLFVSPKAPTTAKN